MNTQTVPERLSRHLLPYLIALGGIVVAAGDADAVAQRIDCTIARASSATERRRIWHQALAGVGSVATALARVGIVGRRWHLLCHLGALALVISYVLLGQQIACGVGFTLGFEDAFAVFSNSLWWAYVLPVPGSYGISEGLTAWLLEVEAAGVLVRVLAWHIAFIPGAILLIFAVPRHGSPALSRLIWSER